MSAGGLGCKFRDDGYTAALEAESEGSSKWRKYVRVGKEEFDRKAKEFIGEAKLVDYYHASKPIQSYEEVGNWEEGLQK